jgi:hypothetical protein
MSSSSTSSLSIAVGLQLAELRAVAASTWRSSSGIWP